MTERSMRSGEVERLYAVAPIGVCYFDAEFRFRYINEWLARINGMPVEAHLGKTIRELLPAVADGILPQIRRVIETGAAEANKRLEEAKQELQRLALFDTLMGLGNRNLFMRQIEHLIALAERRNEEIALLAMDLDGFKEINDRLGHAAGDEVLREFGKRLAQSLRKADRKFRIGGDEFAVLLEPRFGAFDGAIEVSRQIAKRVGAPMEIKGHRCSIGVSIGIAVFPDHGREANALLRKADAAMYEAKKKQQVIAGASDASATTILEKLQTCD